MATAFTVEPPSLITSMVVSPEPSSLLRGLAFNTKTAFHEEKIHYVETSNKGLHLTNRRKEKAYFLQEILIQMKLYTFLYEDLLLVLLTRLQIIKNIYLPNFVSRIYKRNILNPGLSLICEKKTFDLN